MAEPQQTITAEKLCALTGLTDRRHRQLAKDGYFPQPAKGQYQLTPTLVGMFRYYRETREARDALRDEKVRETRARAGILEIEEQEAKRRVISREEFTEFIQKLLTPIRQRYTSLPKRLASRTNPHDPAFSEMALAEECDDALKDLRDKISAIRIKTD